MARRCGRWLSALVIAGSLAGASAPAWAQRAADVAAARELFVQGSQLSSAGDWVHAQAAFERSLKLKRAPITLYSIAIVETHTGRLVEALEHFRAFLAEPSAPATKGYEAPAASAAAELEKRVGRCKILVSPADAPDVAVTVDGEPVSSAALVVPRLVNPGSHVIAATARGLRAPGTPCVVGEGATATVELKLEPVPVGNPVGVPPAPLLPVEGSPGPRENDAVADGKDAVAHAPKSRAIPFGLIGGGAAFFFVGLGVGIAGIEQAKSAPTRDGSAASSARTKGVVGDVLGGVGVAGVAAGVVLLIVQANKKAVLGRVAPAPHGIAVSF